jgi:hypothetical protein
LFAASILLSGLMRSGPRGVCVVFIHVVRIGKRFVKGGDKSTEPA